MIRLPAWTRDRLILCVKCWHSLQRVASKPGSQASMRRRRKSRQPASSILATKTKTKSATPITFIAVVRITKLPAARASAIAMAATTAAIVIILRKRHQPLLVGHGTDLLRCADRAVIANKVSTGAVRDATLFS